MRRQTLRGIAWNRTWPYDEEIGTVDDFLKGSPPSHRAAQAVRHRARARPITCPSSSRSLVSGELNGGGKMRTLAGILLGTACIALLLAPTAQAHRLTAKRAEAALQPAVEQMTPQVAQK